MQACSLAGFARFCRFPAAALTVAAALILTSCSHSGKPEATASSAPPSPSPTELSAAELLDEAGSAAQQMKKYAFELELSQHLSGGSGGDSNVQVTMDGRAELEPLKLDQTIKSDIDGEATSLRSILVPKAYYMYEPEFQEWSKLSESETADIRKTLSDLQVNPAKSVQDIRALGGGLQAKRSGDTFVIRYDGAGPEAKTYLDKILESTLDLSGMDQKIRNSIKLESMQVELQLDSARKWPLSYKIDSVMSVEYEAGKPSTMEQTISGSYSKHNASEAVVVPKDAQDAPELDPAPMD